MEFLQLLPKRSVWVLMVMVTLAMGNRCNGCLEKERVALLQLKYSMNFPNGTALPSWQKDDMDCCQWESVECDSTTRRVIKLSLNKTRDSYFDGNYWHLNASILLPFESLRSLDLSGNQLRRFVGNEGSQEESGMLNKLEVLDLSTSSLDETIWPFLGGRASSIEVLDLSYNDGLQGAFPRLCELKTLRELAIRGIGFRGTLPWCLVNLTSLRLLDITSNHFAGNIAQSPLINLTSLQYLAISNNTFEVPISFKSFFNHSELKFIESLKNKLIDEEDFSAGSPSFQLLGLHLSNSNPLSTTRPIPSFLYYQHDLNQVQISQNIHFAGKFPYWLFENNTGMEKFVLTHNSFVGPLLLPSRRMKNLLGLDISNNHLEGILPSEISVHFPNLEFLNMSANNFEGEIPSSFGEMTSLKYLDLSNNRLSGEIPVQLAVCCRLLELLGLSNNNFKGPVLPHQHNLTRLAAIYSDNNSFTEIPVSLSRSPLKVLDVDANQLVGKIPAFIGNLRSLSILTMAGNHLEGPIPIEFCQLHSLWILDLSKNNITGAIPSCFSSLLGIGSLRLSKNKLEGPFPLAFQEYNTTLDELDLSYNKFSGNIPTWVGSFSRLSVLLLQHNQFEGHIPKEVCNLSRLSLIDLSSNNLFGSIPPCISKIKFDGILVNRIYSYYVGGITNTLYLLLRDLRLVLVQFVQRNSERECGSFYASQVKEVEFSTKGRSLSYRGNVLYLFSGINLSHNRLTSPIPPVIGNLAHIEVLNLSHNCLTGTIPATFSNLKNVESLDLSYNNLNGKIPSQLTELNFLVVFNLSYNNLSGRTPARKAQFSTFEWDSYVGNPLLCGEPLPRKCDATDSPPLMPRASVNDIKEDSGFLDMYVFYMSFAGSYVTVVLAIVAILIINPYWRRAWFHLIEVSLTSYYYFIVDNLAGRRRCFQWK